MYVAKLPSVACAATITVTNPTDVPVPGFCDLRQAIVAHNSKSSLFGFSCEAGDGNDTIVLDANDQVYVSGNPYPSIENGSVTIKPIESNVCYRPQRSAYMTVNSGAKLTLHGIGIVVNGSAPKSVIDNDGGTLVIEPNDSSGLCIFSNLHGTGDETTLGGVLNNRNGGTATIDANFVNSAASDKGGAIYAESGTVTITRGSFNGNKCGKEGGAIYVNKGATLNIKASNFAVNNNSAFTGGAIFSEGGIVNVQRDPSRILVSVSFSSNTAAGGGAIFARGGQLNIDGIQFLGNSTDGDGGAIWFSAIVAPNPASITHTYFRQNSAARKGASIFVTDGSTLNLSGDTFSRNTGGIYLERASTLGVINSTFLGASTSALEGINVASGSADVTFSTFWNAALSGPTFGLSNSLLAAATCTNVKDDLNNLRSLSPSCPASPTDIGLSLSSLQDNGGPTPTIALVTGSPAIGAIKLGNCVDLSGNKLPVDQRDAPRPGPANPGFCDTGAFEFGPATKGLIPAGTPTPY